jgi:hypothetical protein
MGLAVTRGTPANRDPDVQAGAFDKIAYVFALVGLYVMVGGLMFYGFLEKAVDGDFKIPPPLAQQFDKTAIGTVAGSSAAWVIVAILEGLVFLLLVASLVFLLLVASLVSGDFRPSKRKPFLLTCLATALLDFGMLAFGQNATAQHQSVACLYGYFGATVILMIFVRTLPPYTSNRWLG